MKVVCSYCRQEIGEKPPLDDTRPSHTVCPECLEYYRAQWEGLSMGEYLDAFDVPVLVVQDDVRVLAANKAMAELLGKPDRELHGLLGGEALECVHAREPGGCGGTTHCTTCTVREAVKSTLAGEPRKNVKAWVDQDEGRLHVLISTELVDGYVRLSIDNVVGKDPVSA